MNENIENLKSNRMVIYSGMADRIRMVRRERKLTWKEFTIPLGCDLHNFLMCLRKQLLSERLIFAIAANYDVRDEWLKWNDQPCSQGGNRPRKRHLRTILAACDRLEADAKRIRKWVAELNEAEPTKELV